MNTTQILSMLGTEKKKAESFLDMFEAIKEFSEKEKEFGKMERRKAELQEAIDKLSVDLSGKIREFEDREKKLESDFQAKKDALEKSKLNLRVELETAKQHFSASIKEAGDKADKEVTRIGILISDRRKELDAVNKELEDKQAALAQARSAVSRIERAVQ